MTVTVLEIKEASVLEETAEAAAVAAAAAVSSVPHDKHQKSVVDTNTEPTWVTYAIPANDDR